MKLEYKHAENGGRFVTTTYQCDPSQLLLKEKDLYKVIWSRTHANKVKVDGYWLTLEKNTVLFCTPSNVVEVPVNNTGITSYIFNREFYCIQENDSEVSCMGLLFYGASNAPLIQLSSSSFRSFDATHHLIEEEYDIKDQIQGEMLSILLKRLLITSTRLLAELQINPDASPKQVELIRQYNILVEQNFKQKHQVADYADMLNKAPKTLSNFFKKNGTTSPLKIINNRITAEAKRLLLYSDKNAEEIAYELGYAEPSHFSKFFKKQTGLSPLTYRKQ